MVTCTECGAENPAGAVFCSSCDALLGWQDPLSAPREPARTPVVVEAAAPPEPEPGAEPEPEPEREPVPEPQREQLSVPEPAPGPEPVAPLMTPPAVTVPDLDRALAIGRRLAE